MAASTGMIKGKKPLEIIWNTYYDLFDHSVALRLRSDRWLYQRIGLFGIHGLRRFRPILPYSHLMRFFAWAMNDVQEAIREYDGALRELSVL